MKRRTIGGRKVLAAPATVLVVLPLLLQSAGPSGAAEPLFQPAATYSVEGGTGAYAVATADFNADGKLDVAVANSTSSNVSILLGNGDGSLATAATNYPVKQSADPSSAPEALVAGDFVGDSKVDLAVANHDAGNVVILQGAGDGGFATTANTVTLGTTSPQSMASGDLDGDGKLDLVVANARDTGGNVIVLQNNGDGSFATSTTTAGDKPWSVALGDVVSDTKLDLAVANAGASNNASILPGLGDGSFATATEVPVGAAPMSVALGNLDANTKTDIVTANNGAGNLSLILNGDGGLATAAAQIPVGDTAKPFSVGTADFNGDGKADLAVTDEANNNLDTLLGNGDGTFATATTAAVGTTPGVFAIADLNGNGKPDVIVPNRGTSNISVLLDASSATTSTTSASDATTIAGDNTATTSGGFLGDLAATGAAIDREVMVALAMILVGTVLVTRKPRDGS